VLLDLSMPGSNSPAVLEEIHARWPEILVLLTSGYDEDKARSLRSFEHATGFLQKPYTPEVLARVVRKTLDQGRNQ
jgi:two-component system cell cycle sensor histidine kinase/response regulator CckA